MTAKEIFDAILALDEKQAVALRDLVHRNESSEDAHAFLAVIHAGRPRQTAPAKKAPTAKKGAKKETPVEIDPADIDTEI